MQINRVSTLDADYTTGDLSVYPIILDDKNTLYEARNNAVTRLRHTLPFNGKNIIVDDAKSFPSQGLLRIGPPPGQPGASELVYYDKRTDSVFQDLKRGFAGSRRTIWQIGAYVSNAVMAEHHNAIKDAIINIEENLGLSTLPAATSLNGILKQLEARFLAPKSLFRAFPLKGPPPLKVRFQNFSGGAPIRFLWDFGDGSSSTEISPIHTYQREGIYTVTLKVLTSTGAQGIVTKLNYITVDIDETIPFFYTLPMEGVSVATAAANSTTPTQFEFVDQSDGEIVQRFWIFDDGITEQIDDPDQHAIFHTYQSPGAYLPTLLVVFEDQRLKRVILDKPIVVL